MMTEKVWGMVGVTGIRLLLVWFIFAGGGARSPVFGEASGGDETDLALGKPARATSIGFWRLAPSNVTDGDWETGWRSLSQDPLPLYVEVDLEAVHRVNRVELAENLRGGAYRLTGFELHLSIDGDLWEKVGGGSTIGRGVTVSFSEREARFARLLITANDGLDQPVISRIAVFGDPSPQEPAETVPSHGRDQRAGETFRSFGFREPRAEGEIERGEWPQRRMEPAEGDRFRFVQEYERTVTVVVPEGTDMTALVPVFSVTGGNVRMGGERVESGAGLVDFSNPVEFVIHGEDGSEAAHLVTVLPEPAAAVVTVFPETVGHGLRYVGYSAMNITEGDNLAKWYAYSRVNGVRYWLTPGRQVGAENVTSDSGVADADSFGDRKRDLRERILRNPRDNTWINWEGVEAGHRELVEQGDRHTSGHALRELREAGIEIMAALNDSRWAPPFADETEKWQRAWILWQMFYAQSFYLAENFDVWKFQGPNEPDLHLGQHGASPEERAAAVQRFVFMNAVYADAMRAAVADVNQLFGKKLEPIWGAPTLASQPTSDVSLATLRANRTDYHGGPSDADITDLFIMQRYSAHPDSFVRANAEARRLMREKIPGGGELPIAYTEFNFMPGSVWRNQDFTSDDPRVFRAMARVWGETMADGVFGMYQFRIARPINFGGNHVHHMFLTHRDPARNLLHGKPVEVSSEAPGHPLRHALLNTSSGTFAWQTEKGHPGPHQAVWDLGGPRDIRWFLMELGTREEGLREAALQYRDGEGGEWRDFPHGRVRNGSTGHYGGVPCRMPGHNARTPIDSVPAVRVSRVLAEPVTARHIRFVSEDPGPILVRRIFLSEEATGGDIGGPMKSAEVTRLFATGFAGAPVLHKTEAAATHDGEYRVHTAFCPRRERYHLWIPQTSDRVDYRTTFDFSRLEGAAGGLVTVREVSERHFGEVVHRQTLPESGKFSLIQPRAGVWLVTLDPAAGWERRHLPTAEAAQIGLGEKGETVFGPLPRMAVRQHTEITGLNRAVYLKFDLTGLNPEETGAVLFEAAGHWVSIDPEAGLKDGETFTLHLHGLEDSDWEASTLTGNRAPNFGRADSLVNGPGAVPLGVLSFVAGETRQAVDITEWAVARAGGPVTLVLVRERRHENEINETDGVLIQTRANDENARPRLEIWHRGKTSAGQ